MKKKLLGLVLLACASTMLFANGSAEKGVSASQQQSGPVTVTVLATAPTQKPEGPLFDEYVKAFEAAHPDIKIEVSGVPMNQALQKITTLAAAGSLPDLFVNTENNAGKLYDMGICDDMSKYMTSEEMNNIVDAVREGSTIDGKFIMYPWYSAPNALIYRTDWFEEAGLSAPTTLEEMREAAKILTKDTNGDGAVDRYGFGMIGTADDSGETRFVMILRSFGARELYQENGEWKTEVGNQASIAAFKYFVGLKNTDGVVPPGSLENSFNENVNLMAAGQVGMLIAGSNSVGKIFAASPELKGKISSVKMPAGITSYTPISILGWALNPESKVKEQAMKFVKYISGKENATRWVETTGRLPDTKDAIADSTYLQTDLFKGFIAGTEAMELAPAASFYPEVKTVLGRTYQKLMSDPSSNVENEVKVAAAEINKIISDNK